MKPKKGHVMLHLSIPEREFILVARIAHAMEMSVAQFTCKIIHDMAINHKWPDQEREIEHDSTE